jgi:hypothetical protein
VPAGPVAARPASRSKATTAPSLQRGLTEIVFGAES